MMRYDEKSMHSFFKNIYTFCMFNQNRVLPLIRLCLQVFGRKKIDFFPMFFDNELIITIYSIHRTSEYHKYTVQYAVVSNWV